MKRILLTIAVLLMSACVVHAGAVSSHGAPWVSEVSQLSLDNDDYVGDFDASPNKFKLNQMRRQSIFETERIVPTLATEGITEYALAMGGFVNVSEELPPPTSLDSRFQIQLGFGTGENFVRASGLAPDLRFDTSDNVSPAVGDVNYYNLYEKPFLEFIEQEEDILTYQGRTHVGNFNVGEIVFNDSDESHGLRMPIDIPNLDASLRDHYTADELAFISEDAVPFTIRMTMVPGSTMLVGDMNGDGAVNFGDLTPFVWGLTHVPTYEAAFPELADSRRFRGDVNQDDGFNFLDLTPFADLLIFQASAAAPVSTSAAIPEPASWALGIVVAIQLLLFRFRAARHETTWESH